jgi:hypothetical protein
MAVPKSTRPFGLPNPYDMAGMAGGAGGKDNRAYRNMGPNKEDTDQDDGESSPLHGGGGGAGYAQNHNVGGLGGQEQRLLLAPPTQSRCTPPSPPFPSPTPNRYNSPDKNNALNCQLLILPNTHQSSITNHQSSIINHHTPHTTHTHPSGTTRSVRGQCGRWKKPSWNSGVSSNASPA